VLKAGESVRLETPGGGGFGAPAERDPRMLAADIADGRLTPEQAQRDYGADLAARAMG